MAPKEKRLIIYLSTIVDVEATVKRSQAGLPMVTLNIETAKVKYLFDLNKALSQKLLDAIAHNEGHK